VSVHGFVGFFVKFDNCVKFFGDGNLNVFTVAFISLGGFDADGLGFIIARFAFVGWGRVTVISDA
jgi:hypothetical protein